MLVRELTHYLQGSYDEGLIIPTSEQQYTKYLNLPSEQEAFATAAYFFTRKYSRERLAAIMSSNKSAVSKLDELMNYHFRTIGYKVVRKHNSESSAQK